MVTSFSTSGRIFKQTKTIPFRSKKEKVEKGLKIIYEYYCSQQQSNGAHATFERIEKNFSVMNLAKLMMFCDDFKVLYKR